MTCPYNGCDPAPRLSIARPGHRRRWFLRPLGERGCWAPSPGNVKSGAGGWQPPVRSYVWPLLVVLSRSVVRKEPLSVVVTMQCPSATLLFKHRYLFDLTVLSVRFCLVSPHVRPVFAPAHGLCRAMEELRHGPPASGGALLGCRSCHEAGKAARTRADPRGLGLGNGDGKEEDLQPPQEHPCMSARLLRRCL